MAKNEGRRESFVFYRSFYDVFRTLNDNDKIEFMNMIFELGLNRKIVKNSSELLQQLFTLIKPQIDANYRKAIGGKRGGRPAK